MNLELLDLKAYHQNLANDRVLYTPSLIKTWTDEVYKLYLSLRKLLDSG